MAQGVRLTSFTNKTPSKFIRKTLYSLEKSIFWTTKIKFTWSSLLCKRPAFQYS
jgi:hypothetical protein